MTSDEQEFADFAKAEKDAMTHDYDARPGDALDAIAAASEWLEDNDQSLIYGPQHVRALLDAIVASRATIAALTAELHEARTPIKPATAANTVATFDLSQHPSTEPTPITLHVTDQGKGGTTLQSSTELTLIDEPLARDFEPLAPIEVADANTQRVRAKLASVESPAPVAPKAVKIGSKEMSMLRRVMTQAPLKYQAQYGSFKGALKRLEKKGLVVLDWSDYAVPVTLTDAGRAALEAHNAAH